MSLFSCSFCAYFCSLIQRFFQSNWNWSILPFEGHGERGGEEFTSFSHAMMHYLSQSLDWPYFADWHFDPLQVLMSMAIQLNAFFSDPFSLLFTPRPGAIVCFASFSYFFLLSLSLSLSNASPGCCTDCTSISLAVSSSHPSRCIFQHLQGEECF